LKFAQALFSSHSGFKITVLKQKNLTSTYRDLRRLAKALRFFHLKSLQLHNSFGILIEIVLLEN
jgi:hypothetical protein